MSEDTIQDLQARIKVLEEALQEIARLKEQLERVKDRGALHEQIEALNQTCELRLEIICQLRERVEELEEKLIAKAADHYIRL